MVCLASHLSLLVYPGACMHATRSCQCNAATHSMQCVRARHLTLKLETAGHAKAFLWIFVARPTAERDAEFLRRDKVLLHPCSFRVDEGALHGSQGEAHAHNLEPIISNLMDKPFRLVENRSRNNTSSSSSTCCNLGNHQSQATLHPWSLALPVWCRAHRRQRQQE